LYFFDFLSPLLHISPHFSLIFTQKCELSLKYNDYNKITNLFRKFCHHLLPEYMQLNGFFRSSTTQVLPVPPVFYRHKII